MTKGSSFGDLERRQPQYITADQAQTDNLDTAARSRRAAVRRRTPASIVLNFLVAGCPDVLGLLVERALMN